MKILPSSFQNFIFDFYVITLANKSTTMLNKWSDMAFGAIADVAPLSKVKLQKWCMLSLPV